jgi:hypothetical protein
MRAATPRGCPSTTSPIANIRRAAAASDVAAASRRRSLALCSVRVIAKPLAAMPVLPKERRPRITAARVEASYTAVIESRDRAGGITLFSQLI